MRPLACVMAWVLVGACAKRDTGPDPFDAALERSDAAWMVRHGQGIEPVRTALDEAFVLRRSDPRVRWRLARLEVTAGLTAADDVQAQAAYARARGHGWACLDTVPGVAELRRSGTWDEALARVPVDMYPCVSWTGLAWARWRQAAGLSGAIDDDAIQAYVSSMPDDAAGLRAWTVAISDSLYDQSRAPQTFAEAVRRDREDLVRRVDRLLWVRAVSDPTSLQLQGARLLERTPDSLEEEGAMRRLRAAMRGR